ncbi:Uncharacterized protein SCF082_LOCUS29920 [Durusdinium trenchii]|uniref:Uncharacterized protein n=1 Tax=Durusdinium trenchii TaxID=1381693 RepID=A0ABP0MV87_9DINO
MILRTDVGRKSAAAALPGRRVHKSRWFRLAGRMAACWVVWASCFQPVPLTYVGKTGTPFQVRHWKSWSTTMLVREKKGSLSRKNGNVKAPGGGRSRASSSSPGGAKAAMILTRRINKALTAAELLDVLSEAVVFPDFNEFHISAAYHTLATFHQKKLLLPVCAESPVLPKLHARAEERIKSRQIDPRGSANVLWAMAVLLEAIPSTTSLLPVLMNVFPEKAPGMKAQELANCVWASAQLKDVAPEVLQVVPALIAQIPSKVVGMKPQELSNSLWASAHLKDVVPALIAQIPEKADQMMHQALSYCLWATAQLKDDAPDVLNIVAALAAKISGKVGEMDPQAFAVAMEYLKDVAPEVLKIADSLAPKTTRKANRTRSNVG